MNKNGCEAVLSYLIQQLNQIIQDMNINEESVKILTTSLKQFYFSEILFSEVKNTFLSQDLTKPYMQIPSQNECKNFQSSLISYPKISPLAMQPTTNNANFNIQKPFNSSNLMFTNPQPIQSSTYTNIPNSHANPNFNMQSNDSFTSIGIQELMKLLNRVSLLKMIDDTPIPAKSKPNDFSKKTRPWSLKEDNRLLGAIMRYGLDNWSKVSKFVGNNRTRGQCSQRWSRGLNPSISRFEWSPQEDSTLLNYVQIHGNKKWSKISSLIGNRSDVQCRYRYKQLIKKKARIGPDLNLNEEGQNNFEDFKESNSNNNETEDNYSNTDESYNDDKNQTVPDEPKQTNELNQIHHFNQNSFSPMILSNSGTNSNYLNIAQTSQIMHFPNLNMRNSPNSNQNIKVQKIIFPMPESDFPKQIPSLNEYIDIDSFLNKFKE